LLRFAKYKQLEAEGAFTDGREQYLLSALCRLYIWYLSSKGVPMDEMVACFSDPATVQMRLPTEEELKKIEKKNVERGKKFYRGLIGLAKGKGVKVKTISRQQFLEKFGYE
jgi:hypothetical protein